jgi:hypothetical protein
MSIISSNQTLNTVFGELVAVEPTPLLQISNQYALDPALRDDLEVFEATGGTADSSDNLFRCQSGTSLNGFGVIRSKDVAVYRAGQGVECRITATFTTGVASSIQFAGLFSLTETLAFGYDGADFSIIHQYDGEAEVQDLQVTGVAGGAETATITVDGDAFTANLTATTVSTNAFEIEQAGNADGTISAKWRLEQEGDTVVFISKSVGNKTGTFSFSSATATAAFTEATAGAVKSSGNVAQESWNITSTPFTGFDPTQLNLYRLEYGYLGGVSATFSIYNPNTQLFVKVHAILWANSNTTPIFGNPDMKVGWTSASTGSTGTNLTVTGASAYVAVGGKNIFRNQTYADENSVSTVDNTPSHALITLKNRITYGGRFNLGKIALLEVSVENDHTKSITVDVCLNSTVAGTTNFNLVDDVNSIALIDKAGTTVSGGRKVASFQVAANASVTVDLSRFFIELSPEDLLVITAFTSSGSATEVTASITWLEEK